MSQENNIEDINQTGGFNMLTFFSYFTVNVSFFLHNVTKKKVQLTVKYEKKINMS